MTKNMKLTLNISDLSSQYTVRKMTAKDVDCIYELYMENPMYFRYCPPLATKESVSTCAVAIWLGAAIKQQKYNSHILPYVL